MAETIFCLDIHQDKIVAVSVDTSSGAAVVQGHGAGELGEKPLLETLEGVKEQCGFTSGSSRITFGAELFSYRTLTLPFTDKGKIGQILSFELADLSPVDINTLVLDFLITKTTPEGAEILAAMIDRGVFSDCLDSLGKAGIDPETIGISGVEETLLIAAGQAGDFTLVDIGVGWATVIMVVDGTIALIRSITTPPEIFATDTELRTMDFALSIKQTLLISGLFEVGRKNYKVYLSGVVSPFEGLPEILSTTLEGPEVKMYRQSAQPLIKIDPDISGTYLLEEMDRALALALRPGGRYQGFNFRKGDFKKRKSSSDYRSYFVTFGVPALLLLFSALVYWGYTYTSLQKQQEELKEQIAEVFTETLPEVTRIVNPVQQLTVKNREIAATYRPGGLSATELNIVELLAELSARISPAYQVTVVRMVADMETVRLKAATEDFNTVDNVQKELEKSPFFESVSISSATQSPNGDEVSFELKIERRQ